MKHFFRATLVQLVLLAMAGMAQAAELDLSETRDAQCVSKAQDFILQNISVYSPLLDKEDPQADRIEENWDVQLQEITAVQLNLAKSICAAYKQAREDALR